MSFRTLAACLLFSFAACNNEPAPPAGGQAATTAETTSPADSPMKYTVLADTSDPKANSVDFHVLVADAPKHDDVEKLLKFLYRHLMTRREPMPTLMTASVYSNESQYKTPPRSPVATVVQKPTDQGPTFENKVPLEFWQQIDTALYPAEGKLSDKGWKLAKKVERNDAAKSLTLTVPYTEPGKDQWAETLSYNQAVNIFTDYAQELFEKVPELSTLTYIGTWSSACKDHAPTCAPEDVVKVTLDRETYHSLKLNELEEQMGQIHGRAYLEMSMGKGTDKSISAANSGRMAALYKKMLGQMKGNAWVSPKLK